MTTRSIRDAISAGEYAEAAKMFTEFVRLAPLNPETLEEAAELVRWARLTTLCANARLQAQVQELRDRANVLIAYSR